MVKLKDNFIEYILPEDLENLGRRDSLEIKVDKEWPNIYRIKKNDIITLTDSSIMFVYDHDVVDVDYEDIIHLYKIRNVYSKDPINILFCVTLLCETAVLVVLLILGGKC